MPNQIEIVCEPESATDVLADLVTLDGVDARVAAGADSQRAEGATHGMYSLDPLEMTTLLLNVTGTVASLVSIASILLDRRVRELKIKTERADAGAGGQAAETQVVPVSQFKTPEELAAFLSRYVAPPAAPPRPGATK